MEFKLKNTIKGFNPERYVKESVGDEYSTFNGSELIDCSLGVNPFGYSSYIDNFNKENSFNKFNVGSYPQFPYLELKKKIAEYWKDHCRLNDSNIGFGTGSVGILLTINRLFIEKGTKVLGVGPTFTSYSSDVRLSEGIFDHVLLGENENFKFSADKFISRINPEYTLIYIDNPNNPTGQIIDIEEIKQVVAKARENGICVIIDEAYGDFMDNSNSAVNLINDFENLMVVRTFSKGFGLAGLRVGYMLTSDYLSEMYSKVVLPFTLNNIGYSAAITSIKDRNFILSSRKKISEVKKKVRAAFQYMRVLETNNEVPIMTIEFPDKNTNLFKLFKANGVLTEAGEDFTGLSKNFVRMRVPNNHFMLSEVIKNIEKKNV